MEACRFFSKAFLLIPGDIYMNENELLAKTTNRYLSAGLPVTLVSIMSLEGSTPRHDGTKMVIGADGKAYGTIGGSLIEAAAIEQAKKALAAKKSRIMMFELSGKDAAAPGMICGGKAEILLDCIEPTDANRGFAREWVKAVAYGKDFFIFTHLGGAGETTRVLGHAVFIPDSDVSFSTSLTKDEISQLKPELHTVSTTSILRLGDTSVLVDRIRKLKTVYCFGAGHVAVPTAHLAALTGFRVIVLDDRQEYANPERFPEAYKTMVIGDYQHAFDGLEIDNDSFIVIITRGHKYDREILEQSIKTSAGYIGMISSKRKRAAIYDALTAEGVSKERLDFIHSPIGLDIGGETPEEIAVSIVAELIKVRSHQPA
jgi:xanthine dehydrogenase accessory factor